MAIGAVHVVVCLLQGGVIAVKVALDNKDIFAGLVLIAPAFIASPRWLSTSAFAVSTTS